MKKIYTYILMIACAFMFAGCQDDFEDVLTAEIEGYSNGNEKVYINSNNVACWHDGDWVKGKVRIAEQTEGIHFQGVLSLSPNTNTATITSEDYPTAEGKKTYNLAHPANCFINYHTVLFSNQQDYEVKQKPNGVSIQKIKAPMVAHTNNNKLKFKNAGALMKINITNNRSTKIKIESIAISAYKSITTNDDGNIDNTNSTAAQFGGNVNFSWNSSNDNQYLKITDLLENNRTSNENTITLKFPTEQTNQSDWIILDPQANGSYYISVPTNNPDAQYFYITIMYKFWNTDQNKWSGAQFTKATVTPHSLVRNNIYPMSFSLN